MNINFSELESKIRAVVDTIQQKIEDEQLQNAGQFVLNENLRYLILQLDLVQRDCNHRLVNDEGYCTICSKYIGK